MDDWKTLNLMWKMNKITFAAFASLPLLNAKDLCTLTFGPVLISLLSLLLSPGPYDEWHLILSNLFFFFFFFPLTTFKIFFSVFHFHYVASQCKLLFISPAWHVGTPECVNLYLLSILKILSLYLFKYYLSPLLFFWNPVRYIKALCFFFHFYLFVLLWMISSGLPSVHWFSLHLSNVLLTLCVYWHNFWNILDILIYYAIFSHCLSFMGTCCLYIL